MIFNMIVAFFVTLFWLVMDYAEFGATFCIVFIALQSIDNRRGEG